MPDDILIRFSVKDDGSPVIERVNQKIKQTQQETKALVPGLENARQKLTGFIGQNAALIGVLVGVGAVLKDVIGDHIKYANEVRQLSALSGESTEATSRFLQVLDDYKLGADDALLATRALTKNGLVPNIETLAKLSDEYLSINDVEKKNEFILKNLGKGGAQWTEVLNKGSKALREQGDAIADNLILNQKMVDDARKAEIAMDTWNDAIQGVKTTLAVQLLPALTKGLDEFNNTTRAIEIMREKGLNPTLEILTNGDGYIAALRQAGEEGDALKESMLATGEATAGLAVDAKAAEEAIKAEEEAVKKLTARNQEYLSTLGSVTDQLADFEEQSADIKQQQYELRQEINQLISEGYDPLSDEVVDLQSEYDGLSAKALSLAAEQEKAGRRMVLSMLEVQLSIDGLDARETAYLVKKGVEWGIYSETAIAALAEAQREVAGFIGEINNIPTERTLTIRTNYEINHVAIGSFSSGDSMGGRAAGGPVGAGQPYMVGERGPEMFVPGKSGTVMSNQRTKDLIDYDKLTRSLVNALRRTGG